MKRRFRLSKSTDIKRVRQTGKKYAHPLIIINALPNEQALVRIATVASRIVGKNVLRNRIKRQLREISHQLVPTITPGWDILILARRDIVYANYHQIQAAIMLLLKQAKLIVNTDDR